MEHLQQAMTAAADLQCTADAAGVGRITAADREAAEAFGPMIADWIRFNWDFGAIRSISARENAKRARATGSGFGLALAEWLEKWSQEQQHGG